jgi:purine-binding chemotaxis protein CheW
MIGKVSKRASKDPAAAPQGEEYRQEVQLACFRVGAEMYALDIMCIKEIIRPQKLTMVPKAPAFIEGVINLRGTVLPVVDLRRRFDQPVASDRKVRVIISIVQGSIIGLMVDEVAEVNRYTRQDIQPPPQYLKGGGSEFFLGVCRRGDDLVMVLDLEMLLSSSERLALDQIRQQAPSPAIT